MVHKSTHHFDLVNWWLDSQSGKCVMPMADWYFTAVRMRSNAASMPSINAAPAVRSQLKDPFSLDLAADENLKRVYLDNEHHDGYQRDLSVFGDFISIEDDMSVIVRYDNGARMTYHLTAYSPWEGYRIAFNGTKGRSNTKSKNAATSQVMTMMATVPTFATPRTSRSKNLLALSSGHNGASRSKCRSKCRKVVMVAATSAAGRSLRQRKG